jgi:alanine-glyoxylate transaminase/(R)-3-amino-2-methylpropionate-pyruvate transaminase
MVLKENDDPACFIVEPVQGFGGVHKLDDNYLKVAFEMVKNKGGVTIADEVQSGICRTGETFWGFQNAHHGDIEPDIITAAKSMGNGYAIIGAVICKRSIAEAFSKKMWFNTYGSNPVACAASLEVLKILKDDDILSNCHKQGQLINKEMRKLCDLYPDVFKEVRGTGCFQGLEIYGKTPEESQKTAYSIHKDLLKYGVIAGRGSATKNVLRIQPPMIIESKDVLHVSEALEKAALEHINK